MYQSNLLLSLPRETTPHPDFLCPISLLSPRGSQGRRRTDVHLILAPFSSHPYIISGRTPSVCPSSNLTQEQQASLLAHIPRRRRYPTVPYISLPPFRPDFKPAPTDASRVDLLPGLSMRENLRTPGAPR